MGKTSIRNSSHLENQQSFVEANSGLYAQNSHHTTDRFHKTDASQLNKDVEQYIQGVNMSPKSRFEQSPHKDQDYGQAMDIHEGRDSVDYNSSP